MRRVLIIGGNRFLGLELTARLLAGGGHQVTLLNRGNLIDPFGERVQRLRVDRGTDAFDQALRDGAWDVVVDFALYTADQARRAARVLSGRVGHFVAISTGQVYLVRDVVPVPAREADFDGALMPRPTDAYDLDQWTYGVEKREVERVVAEALPCTTLRLPMVHGGRDFYRRFDSIGYRLLDGGPVFVTRPDAVVRHVYGPAVVRQLHALVLGEKARGAYNLAQPEGSTVKELIERIGHALGVSPKVVVTTEAELRSRGVEPLAACPFNQRWMSALDATRAREELGFTHEPMSEWVPAALQASMARWNTTPPPSMLQRALELA